MCGTRGLRSIMSFYIPDLVIYIIAVVSTALVLVMMHNQQKKRIEEQNSKENV